MLFDTNRLVQTPGDLQTHPQDFSAAIPTEPKRPLLVLIAENDAYWRAELRELLDLYGIEVLEAENGEEAIDLTIGGCPDLILINAELPRLDGFEATRLIRNIRAFNELPIVFLSAQTERTFRKRAFAVGGDGFHIAPLDLDRLDRILENFLFRVNKNALD